MPLKLNILSKPIRKPVVAWDLDSTIIKDDHTYTEPGPIRLGIREAMDELHSYGYDQWLWTCADPGWVYIVFESYPWLGPMFSRIITCVDMNPLLCGHRQFKDIVAMGVDYLIDDHGPYRETARNMHGDKIANRYIIVTDNYDFKNVLAAIR